MARTTARLASSLVFGAFIYGCGSGEIKGGGAGGSGGSTGGSSGGQGGAGGNAGSGGGGSGGKAGAGGSGGGSGGSGGSGGGGSGGSGGAGGSGGSGGAPPASDKVGALSLIPAASGGKVTAPFTKKFAQELQRGGIVPESGMKTVPVLADFTGDGKLDVFVNPRLGKLSVYRGNGDGTFAAPMTFGGSTGWGVDAADFNGDGMIDGAMGDHGAGLHAFKNGGGGKLVEASGGLPPPRGAYSGCVLADFSGDGKFDLLGGADQFTSGFTMAFGDGAGTWTMKTVAGLPEHLDGEQMAPPFANAAGFFAADFNGDGKLDFAVAGVDQTGADNRPYGDVFINGGDGTSFTRKRLQSPISINGVFGPSAISASVADVNGDGKLDVAFYGKVFLGDGAGGFVGKTTGIPVASNNHFGDMDGDGKMDLVIHGSTTGLQLWLGDGSGGGFVKADVGLPDAPTKEYGIDVGDLDGNGHLDIVRAHFAGGDAVVLEAWVR